MANTKPFIFIDGTYDDIITNSVDENGETLYDGGVCIAIEPVVPGKFLICSDVGQIYFDNDDNRRILLSGGGGAAENPIKSFTVSPSVIDYSKSSEQVTIRWELSAIPTALTLNSSNLDKTISGETTMTISEDTSFILSATVAGKTQTSTKTAIFMGPIYWGASQDITVDSNDSFENLITALNSTGGSILVASLPNSVTFSRMNSGEYAYYVVPKKLAPNGVSFIFPGLGEGGFNDASEFTYNNCAYLIYRSEYGSFSDSLTMNLAKK